MGRMPEPCCLQIVAPLEIIRINLMNSQGLSFQAALSSLKGAMALRGNTADVIAGASRTGIILPAFAMYKQAMAKVARRLDPALDGETIPRWAVFCAGALAGATATSILFPLEVARTRMAMECAVGESVLGCLEKLWSAEGLTAVYRGLATSLIGVMPFNAIKLTTYDLLRAAAMDRPRGGHPGSGDRGSGDRGSGSARLPPAVTAAVGAVSGVTAATACFPIEVLRRRKMVGEFAGVSLVPALSRLARAEGIGALYRGVLLNAGKVSVGTGLSFVLYELLKDSLRVDGRVPPWDARATARQPHHSHTPAARRTRDRRTTAHTTAAQRTGAAARRHAS